MRYVCLCLFVLLVLPLSSGASFAKGGNMRSQDLYEAQHIGNLPPEVRQQILRLCPDPKALHNFATYTNHLQKVVLHFEHLYCGEKPFCTPSGCPHQSYILSGDHYRLIENYQAPEWK